MRSVQSLVARLQPVRRIARLFRGPWTRLELALLLPCVVLLGVTAFASERIRLRGHVLPGVRLEQRELSGFSERALAAVLEQRRAEVRGRLFHVRVGDLEFRFRGEEVGASVDVPGLTKVALGRGRGGNVLAQLAWRVRRFSSPDTLELEPSFDPVLWHEQIAAFERAALNMPREGGLVLDKGKVERIEPETGQSVMLAAADELLTSALRRGPSTFQLPLSTQVPVTTTASVDAVEQSARRLLSGPLTLSVVWPDTVPLSEDVPEGAREAVLRPKSLASALRVRAREGEPKVLELTFDHDALLEGLRTFTKHWERPSQDARFVVDYKNAIHVEPSAIGVRVDPDQLAEAILAAGTSTPRRSELRLLPADPPRITTQIAEGLGVRHLVSQFSTHHPCCRPRVRNIHRIADLVNGTVVLPGETFSLNGLIGPRSRANGFVPAPTIVHGKMKDTFGGGISQFTTTLFNAVLDGGYEIIERQPHSYYFPRYPMGHEATLSFPKPDFIFKNDTAFGVVLITEYTGTSIRVKLFGDNEGRHCRREVSRRFDFVEPELEYVSDDRVLPGETKLLKRGSRGFSVNVSRTITFADGHKTTQSRKVIYEPRSRVIAVHSCEIPEGVDGYTGEECPEPVELDGGVLEQP